MINRYSIQEHNVNVSYNLVVRFRESAFDNKYVPSVRTKPNIIA